MVDRQPVAATADDQADVARATIARLEEQLRKTPKVRRFERGVLRYNLGLAWSEIPTGDRAINLSRSVASLQKAVDLFDPGGRPIEHARAQNALGTALRELGSRDEAADAFRRAAELVPVEVNPGEHGAALNNLGLVHADLGRADEAVEAFTAALEAFAGNEFLRQRIAVLINLGQALAASLEPERLRAGLERYEQALDLTDPQEHPYQWGLVNHSIGVAYTGIDEPGKAIAAFTDALRVFSRHRWPFQHALTKNNLGLAHAQIGDVPSLRRAVAAYEDALQVLDVRLHREQWEQAYGNLQLAEQALEQAGEKGTRAEHFARLAAEEEGDETLLDLLRERLRDRTVLPEPQRTQALGELDHAILGLDEDAATKVSAAWLNVLMELPHDQFVAGLAARMAVHRSIDDAARERAIRILDRVIGEELLAPQRIRVRDTLYEMGYERPEA
ncbi:MAG: tetratricopeptide repeat protein [Actinomycetota bacterium]